MKELICFPSFQHLYRFVDEHHWQSYNRNNYVGSTTDGRNYKLFVVDRLVDLHRLRGFRFDRAMIDRYADWPPTLVERLEKELLTLAPEVHHE